MLPTNVVVGGASRSSFMPSCHSGRSSYGRAGIPCSITACRVYAMRHDLGRCEEAVAVRVVAMMVRVEDAAERLAGDLHRESLEGPGVQRWAQGVDGEQVVGSGNDAGVAQARIVHARSARLRIGKDPGRELPKLRVPARNRREGRTAPRLRPPSTGSAPRPVTVSRIAWRRESDIVVIVGRILASGPYRHNCHHTTDIYWRAL